MNISGIYALTSQTTSSSFATGIVDIELQTYTKNDEDSEIKYTDQSQNVMPGQVINFIPKISNIGVDCYVRVKVDYINENIDFYNYISGMPNSWRKYGEYYYYDGILSSKDTANVFETIKIPEDLPSYYEAITISVTAEAIQAKNFEPDYLREDPWKGVQPKESVKNAYNFINISKLTVKYENEAINDVTVPDNFFEGLGTAMPGDILSQNITISNKNKRNVKYYLKIELNEDNYIEKELLNRINLLITNKNGQVLYNGKLLASDIILLGQYHLNETDNLKFEISIPSDLENEYTILSPEILWIFSAEYDEKDLISSNPKTGDRIDVAITIFLLSAIGMITVIIIIYRENKKEEYL